MLLLGLNDYLLEIAALKQVKKLLAMNIVCLKRTMHRLQSLYRD